LGETVLFGLDLCPFHQKDTSQEKENVETIEKKLQDALPGVKIVTVKRTAETESEKKA
jgi:hypothetical protein